MEFGRSSGAVPAELWQRAVRLVAESKADAHSRRILGWRAATTMRTVRVLDALEMAIRACGRQGVHDLTGLIHHTDAGSQL